MTNKREVDIDDPRVMWKDIEEMIKPRHGACNMIVDAYWVMHPTEYKIMFWQPTGKDKGRTYYPQANQSQQVSETLLKAMYPWARIIKLPVVFADLDR
jgi:hypothetical protein